MNVRTSAPGKLFLLGEYAVLDGAPAILTAVDRRVTVEISHADDARWQLRTPGLSGEPIVLSPVGTLPDSADQHTRSRLRVFDAVRAEVQKRAPTQPGLTITVDSSEFFRDGGAKLGLGSSAAVAVALGGALAAAHGLTLDRPGIFALALAAHRAAQGGTGSGGDVATSVYGGFLEYTRDTAPTALRWPDGLTMTAVVTGDGSSTMELVERVNDYRAADPHGYERDLEQLSQLARDARPALGSVGRFLELTSAYFDALVTLDDHARAGIVSEHHKRLHVLAREHGGVFKTSGAGGGDVGLVFASAGSATERLLAAFAEAGAQAVPLACGDRGYESNNASTQDEIGSMSR